MNTETITKMTDMYFINPFSFLAKAAIPKMTPAKYISIPVIIIKMNASSLDIPSYNFAIGMNRPSIMNAGDNRLNILFNRPVSFTK